MRLLRQTRIDFLRWWRWALGLSLGLILVGFGSMAARGGLRLGIDFAGGSQIIVRFASLPDPGRLRQALAEAGLRDSQIQEFEGASEVLIRTPRVGEREETEVVERVRQALELVDPPPEAASELLDLNGVGAERLAAWLLEANPLALDLVTELEAAQRQYRQAAERVLEARIAAGLLTSWQQVEGAGIDPAIAEALRRGFYLAGHAVVSTEWVGPQVGRDLRRQATRAVLWSLLGMLAYISYRFEFVFGVAAVLALVHDVLITLGAFSLTGREFNLPVIAAFLTIVGYSLNDTVVVFDRIRENSQVMRRLSLYERINVSINQTLSRTLLTSGTTLLVVLSLYLYGGPVINDFAFALLVGVLTGTYSTIYIANPFVYIWQRHGGRVRRVRGRGR